MHSAALKLQMSQVALAFFLLAQAARAEKPVLAVRVQFEDNVNWIADAIQTHFSNVAAENYVASAVAAALKKEIQGFSFVPSMAAQAPATTVYALVQKRNGQELRITLCPEEGEPVGKSLECTAVSLQEPIFITDIFKERNSEKQGRQGDGKPGIIYALDNNLLLDTLSKYFQNFEHQEAFLKQLRIPLSINPPSSVGKNAKLKTKRLLLSGNFSPQKSIFEVVLENKAYRFRACGFLYIEGVLAANERAPICTPTPASIPVSGPAPKVEQIFYVGRAE